MLAICSLEIQW